MCGIVGCILNKDNAVQFILEGLRRLEYRGYDSVGLAVIIDNNVLVVKDTCSIEQLSSRVNGFKAVVGIGHTRWATHGRPSRKNAHPHVDCKGEIALVHNGIIENFEGIRKQLAFRHNFLSETDTEVIAHLIEENIERGGNFFKSFTYSIALLEGSYAIASIYRLEPDTILCAKKESPLIIGISDKGTFCASDPLALKGFVNELYSLRDGEIAVLKPGKVEVYRLVNRNVVLRVKPKKISLVSFLGQEDLKRSDGTATLEEIREIPYALQKSLIYREEELDPIASCLIRSGRIHIVACGTSYHAGLIGKYYLTKLTSLNTITYVASEFTYWANIDKKDTVIAISQSGETADVISAIKYAKKLGAKIISMVNVPSSTIDRLSDYTLYINAGPEIGVAATKSYVNQLSIELQLATKVSIELGYEDSYIYNEVVNSIRECAKLSSEIIAKYTPLIVKLAKSISSKNSVYFLGTGLHLPTALEGALKLKELSYIHAEGYPAGESKHGPIALVEKGFPVMISSSYLEARDRILSSIEEMRARDAWIIAVSNDDKVLSKADVNIPMPKSNHLVTPMMFIIPWQLLAYFTSKSKGLNPDKPRNLAKSVTVK